MYNLIFLQNQLFYVLFQELGKDARYLSLACRIAAEQGAHIVKTYYCDNFEKVVQH